MSTFIRHIVADMDESFIQRCLICGETISDYNGTMAPKGTPPPKGFAAGEIFVRPGNPKITQIAEPDNFKPCRP